jgi:hypothetical protein
MTIHVDTELNKIAADMHNSAREFWLLTGRAPSKQELARSCKCSLVSIYKAEKVLKRKGYMTGVKGEARTLVPTDLNRVILHEEPDPWAELDEDQPRFWRM